MPPVSKIRLSFLLLFLQLFVYLYVVPREAGEERGTGKPEVVEEDTAEFPLEADCRSSYPPTGACLAGSEYFKELAGNCGRKEEIPAAAAEEEVTKEEVQQEPEAATTPVEEEEELPQANLSKPPEPESPAKEAEGEAKQKSGNLIYQIIVVLLFLSVSFALADCFQERAKKKAHPECERHDGLSRRMSLADLTMSRHARKESQASYRPLGKPSFSVKKLEGPIQNKSSGHWGSCSAHEEDLN